jgi:hypothetical protein
VTPFNCRGIAAQPFEVDELVPELPEREPGRLLGIDIAEVAAGPLRSDEPLRGAEGGHGRGEKCGGGGRRRGLGQTVIDELHAQAATAARRAVDDALEALGRKPMSTLVDAVPSTTYCVAHRRLRRQSCR